MSSAAPPESPRFHPGNDSFSRTHQGSTEVIEFRADSKTVTYSRTLEGFAPHEYRGVWSVEGDKLFVHDKQDVLLEMELKTFYQYWVKQTTIDHVVHEEDD